MLKSAFAVLFLPVAALLSLASPAKADPLPTYSYFYTCASTVESCSDPGFAVENNGDFGMDGLGPINSRCYGLPSCGLTFGARSSNTSGEVIGNVFVGDGFDAAYGFNGQVFCLSPGCGDDTLDAIAINNNGIWIVDDFIQFGGIYVGYGAGGSGGNGAEEFINDRSQPFGFDGVIALGINDFDQILVYASGPPQPNGGTTIEGILSPFAVPEPSSIALLATVIGVFLSCTWLRRKRKELTGIKVAPRLLVSANIVTR